MGDVTMQRKKANRVYDDQIGVRVPLGMREPLKAAIEATGLLNAKGKPVKLADVTVYWVTWFLRLAPEDRRKWVGEWRRAREAAIAEEEAEGLRGGLKALPQAVIKPGSVDRAADGEDDVTEVHRLPKGRRRK